MKTNLTDQNGTDTQMTSNQSFINAQFSWKQLLEIKKIIKSTLKNSIAISKEQKLTLITQIQKLHINEPLLISRINQLISSLPINLQNLEKERSNLNDKIMQYLIKITISQVNSHTQGQVWKYKSLLWQSQALLDELEGKKSQQSHNKQEIIQLLYFNHLVSSIHLQSYKEAIDVLNKIEKISKCWNVVLQKEFPKLKKIVLMKMGLPLQNNYCSKDIKIVKLNIYNKNINSKQKNQYCFKILTLTKDQLIMFLEQLSANQQQVSILNVYNLALLCKRYKLFQWALILLNHLTKQSQIQSNEQLYAKLLILTCQIHQQRQDLQLALESLQKIKLTEVRYSRQIKFHCIRLTKQIKLREVTSTCPHFTTDHSRKYMLLQNLQNQLNKIIQKPQNNQLKKNSLRNYTYKLKSKRGFKYPKNISNQQTNSLTPLPTLRNKQSSKQILIKLSEKKQLDLQKEVEHFQVKKKGVTFKSIDSQNNTINSLIYNNEQKINEFIMENCHQQAQKEINLALTQIKNIQNKQSFQNIQNFKIKCISWLRALGKNEKTIPLLKNFLKTLKDDQHLNMKIVCMQQLSKSYQELNDIKNAIAINIQLTNLGEIESYNKIGQLYMIKKDYNEAFKYYQKYNQLKNNIHSKIKFAHICSKMSRFAKISIDILSQILFQNKSNLTFKQFESQMYEEIQSAVILLISIYLNKNAIDKAQKLCIEYLKVNFGAFPIYYMLGIISSREGHQQVAFNHFLTALKLKPNYVPALVQILNYIGVNETTNIHIISILRKAFICNHRNWEILQLFIQALTRIKNDKFKTSVKELLDCAEIFEQTKGIKGGLKFQAQIVLLWALQKIEQYKKKGLIVDNEHQNKIYLKLADLNLQKGNYIVSQDYYQKFLYLIKLRNNKATSKLSINRTAKIQIQILKKLAYIKLQQKSISSALQLLKNCYSILKRYNLTDQMPEVLNKINFLQHHQITQTT